MMMKKYFIKRFRYFFLIMLIPTLLLFCVSLYSINMNARNNIQQAAGNTLDTVQDNFELVISNSAYQYDLLTYNPRLVLSLQKLLLRDSIEYTDIIFLNSMQTILSTVANSQPSIDSIYLYINNFDNFFSSKDSITLVSDYFDNSWYNSYTSMAPSTKQWIEKRSYQEFSYANKVEVISIFQRMTNIRGLIVINMNQNQLKKTLNSNVLDNKELVLMLNKDNSVLISNELGSSLLNQLGPDFIQNLTGTDFNNLSTFNSKWLMIGNKNYLFNSKISPEYDVAFLSLVPSSIIQQKSKDTLVVFLLILLLNCLIILLLSYLTTKRNFQQIEFIIEVFNNAEKGIINTKSKRTVADEYDIILNNIINLFLNTTYLNHQLAEKQYKQEIAELASLQLQINPHFLFNTLQTLDLEALKLTAKPSPLNHIIHDLSDILKYSLEDAVSSVSLYDELNYLKKYADIQHYRYGKKFIIYYEIADNLLEHRVFRLMLQPLIENSISHGIRPLGETGYIKLKIFLRYNHLYFYVIDTGVGMSKDEISALYTRISDDKSKNIGMTNLNRRLVLKYGLNSGLHIQSKKGIGSCISFRIPCLD